MLITHTIVRLPYFSKHFTKCILNKEGEKGREGRKKTRRRGRGEGWRGKEWEKESEREGEWGCIIRA